MLLPKPPGRSLMNVRGDAASRGMTAHDRIRLTGPFAEFNAPNSGPLRRVLVVGVRDDSPGRGDSQPGLTIFEGRKPHRGALLGYVAFRCSIVQNARGF
jgi:hypothetical protein